MAARLLLLAIAFTLGLISDKTIGIELGVRLVSEPPGEAVGTRGRFFQLQCGPPDPGTTISWLKDGRPLETSSRLWVAPNGTLVFNKIVHKKKGSSDAGEYRCLAKNKNGALLSRPSRLVVPGISHEFSSSPESRNLSEGDVTRLTCYIQSNPPALITWLKDSQTLPQTKRFTAFESGVLYITNIKEEDAGNYSCEAHNSYLKKSPRSSGGVLEVGESSSPRALSFLPESPPATVTAKAGKTVIIPCAVSGIPKPITVWYHNKPDGSNTTLQTSNNGLNVLRLNKLSHNQHSGSYVCTATQTTKDNTITVAKKVVLIVETPGVIVEKPKTQIYPAAKTVRIDCEVKGHPLPQVVWYKDGVRLFINGRIKQNARQLVLGAVVSQDTGVYQCFAGSDVWAAGRLVVNSSPDQPQPPTNLTCIPLSPTQIQLTWAPIQPAVQAYSIHYFPTEGGEEYKEVSPNYTYTVQKLQPYTNYTFYIRSYGRSASEQSRRVICSTGETVPSGGPQVNVSITGSQCLLVTWSPPPINKARGAITSYKIQWKRANQSSVNFELLPPHINQYRISEDIMSTSTKGDQLPKCVPVPLDLTDLGSQGCNLSDPDRTEEGATGGHLENGLEPGQKYMVRVMGATALGWPEFTDSQDWTNITLPTTVSSFPPPSVTISPVNSTAIRVDWSYNNGNKIDGFILTYKLVGRDSSGNITIPVNITSYLISKLESGSWYDISMKAYSGDTYGEDCSETVLVGGDSSLPPPSLKEALPTSPSSIRVSWRSPPHSFVSHYTLEIASRGKTLRTLFTNKTGVDITKLNGNTVYEVRVKAHGLHNESSSYSSKLECRTPPYVLSTVGEVKWSTINSTSVLISWTPLQVPVTSYEVFFTRDLSAPIDLWHTRFTSSNQSSILIGGLKSSARHAVRVRGVGSTGPGPLSSNVYFKLTTGDLPPEEEHKPHTSKSSDQLLGILVGCGISFVFVLLCTASLILRRRCLKANAPPSQREMVALTNLQPKAGVRNGQVNGMKLFPNGRLPNGHTALRITENPQCEAAGGSRREAESLLNETQTTTVDLSQDSG